jgi:hypothetical protein
MPTMSVSHRREKAEAVLLSGKRESQKNRKTRSDECHEEGPFPFAAFVLLAWSYSRSLLRGMMEPDLLRLLLLRRLIWLSSRLDDV